MKCQYFFSQVFQTAIVGKIHCRSKQILDWTNADVIRWLSETGLQTLITVAQNTCMDGKKLTTLAPEVICSGFELGKLFNK